MENGSLPCNLVESLLSNLSISDITSMVVSSFLSYSLFTSSMRLTNGTSYPVRGRGRVRGESGRVRGESGKVEVEEQ